MKRLKGIFLSTLLILCLFLNAFEVRADSGITYETAIEYSSAAHHHFATIGNKIPPNVIGSCAYVSMSLILSFYDSYWHDVFVAEDFEYNGEWDGNEYDDKRPIYNVYSKDLNKVPLLNLENDAWEAFEAGGGTYSDFVNNSFNQAKYIHLYLISLGIARGYHSGDSSDISYGLDMTEQVTILDDYFDLIFGEANYSGTNGVYDENLPVEIHFISTHAGDVNREDVISKINEQLAVGNPVTYNGWKIEGNENNNLTSDKDDLENTKVGHSMVAYAVETKSDGTSDILLHKGHISAPYTSVNQTEYSHNIEACWIEINEDVLPHVCPTENEEESFYDYFDICKEKGVCACQLYGEKHPEHEHEIYYVQGRARDKHIYYCICGKHITEPHTLNYKDHHTSVCACGYEHITPHQYTYQQISNGQHLAVCECGYQYEEAHSLSYQRATEDYHLMACICGYNYQVTHTLTYKDYHTDVCECGYERTTPHDYDYEQVSDTHHFASCECGYEAEMWHTYTCRSISDSYHSQTCPCGHIGDPEAHAFERVDLRYSVCKDCGYRRDNLGPGGNVQMGEEKEEDTE